MGRVILSTMVSLDGFTAGPNGELDWILIDEELHTFVNDQCRAMGAFHYGRRTYDVMAAFWPTGGTDPSSPPYVVEFAHLWNRMPKIVFSRSLDRAEWATRVIGDHLTEELTRLKEQFAGDLMLGGANIASTFMRLGLIDEYQLYVHPVILGRGTRLFGDLDQRIGLRLVGTRTFRSGVVLVQYGR